MTTIPRTIHLAASALILAMLAACQQAPVAPEYVPPVSIGRDAVTFQGDIPCADCPLQRMTVTLFPDRTFRLRIAYPGATADVAPERFVIGRWQRAQDDGANRLRLSDGDTAPHRFRIVDADTLRLLDAHGRDIESPLNYSLKRQQQVDLIAGPMPLRGLYAYKADAATFQECRTGKRYSVMMTGDHAALERAYLATKRAPGTPALATFSGRFAEQVSDVDMTARTHVMVAKFEQLLPGEHCAAQTAVTSFLTDTYWRPVELEGQPVTLHSGTREPHLILTDGDRAHGYSGCNNFNGAYEQADATLRFEGIISTRMTCQPDNDLEQRFFTALNVTASQRIAGESLTLLDGAGKVRARFEARHMP